MEATLIVFCSANGRDGWHPIKPEEVPDWVKNPEVMARLASGEECMDCGQGDVGSCWYRAIHASDLQSCVEH